MGREVQPIPLTTSELEAGEVGRVSGWGTLSKDNETLPLQLHYAIGVTVSREECNKAYEKFGGITENMICAAFLNMGPCFGDSGDALSVDHILIGIVSWSFECGESTHPTVYSNVAVLRSFITEETGVN
jgi:trypsin